MWLLKMNKEIANNSEKLVDNFLKEIYNMIEKNK